MRKELEEVSKLLKLPHHVIPLFGLTVGHPAGITDKKPRLPFKHVYHEETYEPNHEQTKKELTAYNEEISAYYNERTNGKRQDTWTGQMAEMLSNPKRMYMKEFVEKQGFNKK